MEIKDTITIISVDINISSPVKLIYKRLAYC